MDFGGTLYEWYSNSLPKQALGLAVRLHFDHGKGSGVMAPIAANCVEHVSTRHLSRDNVGLRWKEEEHKVLLLVSRKLWLCFRTPQQRHSTCCQNVRRNERVTVSSQAVTCGTRGFVLPACPTLHFQLNIHIEECNLPFPPLANTQPPCPHS